MMTELELRRSLGEVGYLLARRQTALHLVDDAERTQGTIARRHQQSDDIAARLRPGRDERIGGETLVSALSGGGRPDGLPAADWPVFCQPPPPIPFYRIRPGLPG